MRDAVTERWGSPETDQFFWVVRLIACFRDLCFRCGNIVIGLQPQEVTTLKKHITIPILFRHTATLLFML